MSENSTREYHHTQDVKYKFQMQSYAPGKTLGGKGRTRFSVESMVYITGVGYDIVDVFNSGNELALAFYKYVQFKEFMGYEHLGLTSQEIKNKLENIWNQKIE